MKKLKHIRGAYDMGPEESQSWDQMSQKILDCVQQFDYQTVRLPCLENATLFQRTVGETSDIVSKEMYRFTDQNNETICLRPEGTASCVRAGIQHGWFYNQTPKLCYHGPMFRRERPQKGRYRQFYQLGLEAFGFEGTSIELEMLLLTQNIWQVLNLPLQLEINSIGDIESRQHYLQQLQDYFEPYKDSMNEDLLARLAKNPLRLLDSKEASLQPMIAEAPSFLQVMTPTQRQHFEDLQQLLHDASIPFTINSRLVRGLDYYNDTVFEWTTDQLGAQATVCAGGRYDSLVAQLGGTATPAIGLAMGLERLHLLYQMHAPKVAAPSCMLLTGASTQVVWNAYHRLKHLSTNLRVDHQQRSVKSLQKKSKQLNIQTIVDVSETELTVYPQCPPFEVKKMTMDELIQHTQESN